MASGYFDPNTAWQPSAHFDIEKMMRVRKEAQEMAAANALKQLFADSANVQNGQPTQNALQKAYAINPEFAMSMSANSALADQRRAAVLSQKQEAALQYARDLYSPLLVKYDEGKAAGTTEPQLNEQFARGLAEAKKTLLSSGHVGPEQAQLINSISSYAQLKQFELGAKDYYAGVRADQSQQRQDQKEERLASKGDNTATQVLQDPTKKDEQGNTTPYIIHPNMPPDDPNRITDLAGKPYVPGGAAKMGTFGAGATKTNSMMLHSPGAEPVSVNRHQDGTLTDMAGKPINPPPGGRLYGAPREVSDATAARMAMPNDDILQRMAYYDLDPPSPNAPNRTKVMERLVEINPDYDSKKAAAYRSAALKWPLSVQSRTVASLDTVTQHLAYYRDLMKAKDAGDVQAITAIANKVGIQFNSPLMAKLTSAQPIVADELAKAVVGSVNAEKDREQFFAALNNKYDTKAAEAAVDSFTTLMAGKIAGIAGEYHRDIGWKGSDLFTSLAPETKNALQEHGLVPSTLDNQTLREAYLAHAKEATPDRLKPWLNETYPSINDQKIETPSAAPPPAAGEKPPAGAPAGAGAGQYSTKEDVKAAYESGKLTLQQARELLMKIGVK